MFFSTVQISWNDSNAVFSRLYIRWSDCALYEALICVFKAKQN